MKIEEMVGWLAPFAQHGEILGYSAIRAEGAQGPQIRAGKAGKPESVLRCDVCCDKTIQAPNKVAQ
jgi:hypothetical protein